MASSAGDGYRGIVGTFPYAWRVATSWGFRAYVVLAGVVTVAVTIIVAGGVFQLLAQSGQSGGVGAFARAFYIVVGVAVVVPIMTPVVVVARRHRHGSQPTFSDQRVLAGAGYLFLAVLYVGLIASTPESNQQPVTGILAPVVDGLYALPRFAGVVFPIGGAVTVYLAVQLTGES